MKTPEIKRSHRNIKFREKRNNDSQFPGELSSPRFEIRSGVRFKPEKATNSLLFQMYSQENEILFI
jgi:hypothetical protein